MTNYTKRFCYTKWASLCFVWIARCTTQDFPCNCIVQIVFFKAPNVLAKLGRIALCFRIQWSLVISESSFECRSCQADIGFGVCRFRWLLWPGIWRFEINIRRLEDRPCFLGSCIFFSLGCCGNLAFFCFRLRLPPLLWACSCVIVLRCSC